MRLRTAIATSTVRIRGKIRNGSSTRRRTMKPAAFEPTDRYAVTGGGHPHQPGAGEQGEGKKFAEAGLWCRALNAHRDRRRKVKHHHQHARGGGEGNSLKKK